MTTLRAFWAALQRSFAALFGRWQWQAPGWMTWVERPRDARVALSRGESEACRASGVRGDLGRRRQFWVREPAQAALCHLHRAQPRADRIQRQRDRLHQVDEDRVQRIGCAVEAVAEGGDDRHRPLAGHRRHVVLDQRQGTSVHAEGRLAGRRRVLGAVGQERPARQPGRARGLRLQVQEPAVFREHHREPVLSGSARSQT